MIIMSKKFTVNPKVRDIGAGAFLLGSAYMYSHKTQVSQEQISPIDVLITLGLGGSGVILLAKGFGLFKKGSYDKWAKGKSNLELARMK